MLGSLARWLRILGYDTAYDNQIEDDEIIERCRQERRVALTRDRRLAQRSRLRGCPDTATRGTPRCGGISQIVPSASPQHFDGVFLPSCAAMAA